MILEIFNSYFQLIVLCGIILHKINQIGDNLYYYI